MNRHTRLFGRHIATGSALHRFPVWLSMLLVIGLAFTPVLVGRWWLSVTLLGLTWALIAVARLPWRAVLALPPVLTVLIVILIGYHLWANDWRQAVFISTNLLICVYAARLLIGTQPTPALVDALARGARPLRFLGLDPEKFALAVAVMLRSIPYLLGLLGDVRDAARARGLERNPLAQISPMVVRSVGYAVATGEALAARGLGESDTEPALTQSEPTISE